MSEWLELELAHRLRPVVAPEDLWHRIEQRQRGMQARRHHVVRSPVQWRFLPVAAAVCLGFAALWLANIREPVLDIRQFAAAGGLKTPLGLHSADPGEIRTWLHRQADLDVPLRAASGIRLQGARILRSSGKRVAAVEYRIGQDSATLLVAHADPACPLPPHGGHTAAWQSHDQVYVLACSNPERAEAACLLCHSSL
jgi:anti-sigma factor RsiW